MLLLLNMDFKVSDYLAVESKQWTVYKTQCIARMGTCARTITLPQVITGLFPFVLFDTICLAKEYLLKLLKGIR